MILGMIKRWKKFAIKLVYLYFFCTHMQFRKMRSILGRAKEVNIKRTKQNPLSSFVPIL